jgi:hypothetical protein
VSAISRSVLEIVGVTTSGKKQCDWTVSALRFRSNLIARLSEYFQQFWKAYPPRLLLPCRPTASCLCFHGLREKEFHIVELNWELEMKVSLEFSEKVARGYAVVAGCTVRFLIRCGRLYDQFTTLQNPISWAVYQL